MMNQFRYYVGAGCQPARIFLFLFVFLLSAIAIHADTHTATSCSQEHVQAAINAASDGDIVLVPAGSATWTSSDQWTGAIKIINKGITLQGAGVGNTVIKSVRAIVGAGWECAICVNGAEGKPFRVTGFTFNKAIDLGIKIKGTCKNWRVDHCEFICQPQTDSQGKEVAGVNAIAVDDFTYGVVDHCQIQDGEININSNENNAWDRPLTLGSVNAVYVEQCVMRETTPLDDVIDGRSGARYVLRYNSITNMELHCHGIEGGGTRGTHSYELYANMLIDDGKFNCYRHGYIRGGTGVIYDNVSQGKWAGDAIQLVHQCARSGYCDPSKSTSTYPGKDQIGRSTDSNHDGVQDLEPLYAWNNKRSDADQQNGNPKILLVVQDFSPEQVDYIKAGRDFYNDSPRPGYVPYIFPHPLTVQGETGRLLSLQAAPSGNVLAFNWQPINGAVSYRIVRDWQETQAVIVTGTNWTDTAPFGGHVYMVYALDGSGKILAAEGEVISAFPQSVSLAAGWNWISLNVLPADLSFNSVLTDILAQVEQVKTQTQSALRSAGNWKGDLADMNGIGQNKMFKVKVSGNCTLTVSGSAIAPASPIALVTGWNWVAYLPTITIPIATALDSIKGQVLEVKSLTTSATYSNGSWSGTLTQFEPGQGYAIKMNAPGTLIYPTQPK